MGLALVITVLTVAAYCGAVAWGLLRLTLRVAGALRFEGVFPDLVQNVPGAAARGSLKSLERDISTLAAGLFAALATAVALVFYGVARLQGVWMWVLFGLACALAVAWLVFLVKHLRGWRDARFAARAQAALAAALARLALQGHRVFHDVPTEAGPVDHVVLGPRGLFAIRVVARRPRKGAPAVVRINGRSVEFQDGFALLDTLSLAERGARAVADMKVPGLSHRPHVLPVVALPGWEIAPAQGQAGETFLMNEKTAVLLLKASKPADHVMDTDLGPLQEMLTSLTADPIL